MSLHQATKPVDGRWVLHLQGRSTLGTIIALDDIGQRWESTRFRRYATQQWDCGHRMEAYQQTITRRGADTVLTHHHHGHPRFWLRKTRVRGAPDVQRLCEMTATLNPTTGLPDITPADLVERTA